METEEEVYTINFNVISLQKMTIEELYKLQEIIEWFENIDYSAIDFGEYDQSEVIAKEIKAELIKREIQKRDIWELSCK